MSFPRLLLSLCATAVLSSAAFANNPFGIEPIPDQTIPSGKMLVVPIPATDPDGPARTYTVTTGTTTVTTGTTTVTSGSTTVSATAAGIMATVRTGDPHFMVGVSYTDTNSVVQTGTMEFQLLREFAPTTSQIIGGLTQGGFYSPRVDGTNGVKYITFHRVLPGFVIQGGDPNGDGSGGPGFTFDNEYSSALIFSGTAGQLAMANSGHADGGTDGSQFFITLSGTQRTALDYGYTIFGQLLRGSDTLFGISNINLTFQSVGSSFEQSKPIDPVNITSATVFSNDTDAVLLLSATGVCDSTVTVSAVVGSSTTSQTFAVHAVADTIDDPPFLQPVPNSVAPNGYKSVTLMGTDLELDLLSYGYERVLPVADSSATSGTSPTVSIPLYSNADNTVAAILDHWNPTTRGSDVRFFHVGAGEKALSGALSAIPIANERVGSSILSSPTIATFTAGNLKDTTASFTVSVNWGDGTYVTGTGLTVVKDKTARTINKFQIVGNHAYQMPGEFPIIVKIADTGGARLTLGGTANISLAAPSIAISGTDLYRAGGVFKNQVVASFNDNTPGTSPGYAATIDWGDGAVTSGSVGNILAGIHKVYGTHTYQRPDTFTVGVTVVSSGSGNATGNVWSTAHISGVTAPPVFPPFAQAHLAQAYSAIYSDSNSITTTGSGGGNPYAAMVEGTDGFLYGTTANGGGNGDGTVFQISTSGSLNTLYSFTGGSDGANPNAALIQGTDGFLYGTTTNDGANGYGTVFQISTSGSLNTLYSFTGGSDGGHPFAALVAGTDGFLYGTSESGSSGFGTVYQISTSGSLNTLYSFTGGNDGGHPFAPLLAGTDGFLYGTTRNNGSSGFGTVFQISTSGTLNTLYSFTGGSDGGNPFAGVISGTDGFLYGTTESGSSGFGAVYQMSTSGSLTTLYSFLGGNDGANPYSALVQGTNGNLYGTTVSGGTNGLGEIFEIGTIPSSPTTLYSFTSGTGGRNPFGGLILASDGNFYGTTEIGGTGGFGTVFQLATSGSVNTIYSFGAGQSFQIALRFNVAIVNSGNKQAPANATYSFYVDTSGTTDGQQTAFSSGTGQSVFPVVQTGGVGLLPGKMALFSFLQNGSTDDRLKLPVGYDPTGQKIIGVVTYSDPVGDFDGSQKIISPGSF